MLYLAGCAIDGCGGSDNSTLIIIVVSVVAVSLIALLIHSIIKKTKKK